MQSRDKCLFLHCKVEEQPRKSFQHGKGDDKSAVAIVKTLPQLGYVSQDSEPSELPNRTGTIHSLRYVKQVSEKVKDCRMEKYKSNFLISEVPTLWSLRTDVKKRPKVESDAPAARHGIFPEIFASSNKRTMLHSVCLPKSVLCRPHPP